MTKEKIARINELYHKMKDVGLTEEEKAEQASLRREYIADFRAGFTGILDNTYIQRPDGTKTKLKQNEDDKKDGE